MRAIADFVLAVVDLIETESRHLQRRLQRFLVSCALLLGAIGFLALGIVLVLWGVYAALFPALGHPAAAFITAGAMMLVAVIWIFASKWLIQ